MNLILLLLSAAGAIVSVVNSFVWRDSRDIQLFWLISFWICITLGGLIIKRRIKTWTKQ